MSQPVLGSRTSPYLQSKLVLLGCENVFAQIPDLVASLLCIEVNTSQSYRICQAASQALEAEELEEPSSALQASLESGQAPVYGMVDGSFLLLDGGWQEVKVGRVFTAVAHQQTASEALKWQMEQSEYIASRGNCQEFSACFERLLPADSAAEQVFVTDGAIWIQHWLERSYPHATHILDFFHVKEKLADAAQFAISPQMWLNRQCDQLLEGSSSCVEEAVRLLPMPSAQQEKLLHYLQNNRQRMRYNEYRKRKRMISSGPIESAHRTLLQARMKRSGQRWSEHGADNMIKLRTAVMSKKMELVYNLFRNKAA